MCKLGWINYVPLGSFVLLIYVLTASSSIGFADSGLFAASAVSLGIPLAPGFPAYQIFAHLFTYLPFLTSTQKLNLFSSVASVGTVLLIFWFIHTLVKQKSRNLIVSVSALGGALSLAFSYQFWSDAIKVETFAFSGFMLVLLLALSYKLVQSLKQSHWKLIGESKKVLFSLAFALGLSSGVSPTVVVVIPSLLFWLFSYRQEVFKNWRFFTAALALTLTVFVALYAYLPIRALAHPFLNYGAPKTLSGALELMLSQGSMGGVHVLEDGTVEVTGFHWVPGILWESFFDFWKMLLYQFNPLLLPVIALGIWDLFRKNRRVAIWLLLVPLTDLVMTTVFLSGNQEDWRLYSWIILSIFIGAGLVGVFERWGMLGKKRLTYLLPIALCLLPLLWYFPKLNRANDTLTTDFLIDLYQGVPEGAVVMGNDNFFESQTAYGREVLKLRRDIIPVSGNWFHAFSWYRENLSAIIGLKISPTLEEIIKTDKRKEQSRLLIQLAQDNPERNFFITPLYLRMYLQDSMKANCRNIGSCEIGSYVLLPHGLLFELVDKKAVKIHDESQWQFRLDKKSLEKKPFYLEQLYSGQYWLLKEHYSWAYEALGDYFVTSGKIAAAQSNYQKAAEISISSEFVYRLAIAAEKLGQMEAAKYYYEKAMTLSPSDQYLRQQYQLLVGKMSGQKFISEDGLEFFYPPGWKVSSKGKGVRVKGEEGFVMEMELDKREKDQSMDNYLQAQTITYGILVNQGLAQIPNTDFAYVKVWNESGVNKMEFFLFKSGKVIKILVYPSDSPLMKQFDRIVSSLKFS